MVLKSKRKLLAAIPFLILISIGAARIFDAFGLVPNGAGYWPIVVIFGVLLAAVGIWLLRPVASSKNGGVVLKGHSIDLEALRSWSYEKHSNSHHEVILKYDGFSPYRIELYGPELGADGNRVYDFLLSNLPAVEKDTNHPASET